MTKQIFLDNRLMACAELVRKGAKVVDIGTDHAYLPIWLIQNSVSDNIIAADIVQGPLSSAQKNIISYHVDGYIKTKLSDGLQEISSDEADDIIIAGMGGEMIAKIIDNSLWVKNSEKNLILQPMSSSEDLRAYLYKNGFEISLENAVFVGRRVYTVILAKYTSKILDSSLELEYIGKLDARKSIANREYILSQLKRLHNKRKGAFITGEDVTVYDEAIQSIENTLMEV